MALIVFSKNAITSDNGYYEYDPNTGTYYGPYFADSDYDSSYKWLPWFSILYAVISIFVLFQWIILIRRLIKNNAKRPPVISHEYWQKYKENLGSKMWMGYWHVCLYTSVILLALVGEDSASVVANPSPDSWTRLRTRTRTRCAGLESADLRVGKFFNQIVFMENFFCTLFCRPFWKKDAQKQ